jgi:hypothetical protein
VPGHVSVKRAGEPVGVTVEDRAEYAPHPIALWAWTLHRYATPGDIEVTVTGDDAPVA